MNDFLVSILNGINSIVNSYGVSMIIFTVLIKLLLLPLDYKSRKSMRRMTTLQPQMAKLQKKYANDKEKLNQKVAELYRREGVNPMSGCLPMLLSMAVLLIMFAAMRTVANPQLPHQDIEFQHTGQQVNESFLWIRNIWMPDSPFYSVIADNANLRLIPADIWTRVFQSLDPAVLNQLAGFGIDVQNVSTATGEAVFAALQTIPAYAQETALWATMPSVNLIFFQLSIYANNNGWFILPILAAVTQYLMTLTQPQQPSADPNNPAAGTGKFMKYFFPLFSLWICSSYNSLFSLYWVVSNLFAWVQSLIMNKMFDKMDAEKADVVGEGSLK